MKTRQIRAYPAPRKPKPPSPPPISRDARLARMLADPDVQDVMRTLELRAAQASARAVAEKYAQAGFEAGVRQGKQGQARVKHMVRDAAGQIVSIVEEDATIVEESR